MANAKRVIGSSYKLIGELDKAEDVLKEALYYQDLYKDYSDSTFNQAKIEDFKELELSYGIDQKLLADSLQLKINIAIPLGLILTNW